LDQLVALFEELWKEGYSFCGELFHVWGIIYHHLDFREKRILVLFNKGFYMSFHSYNQKLGKQLVT
jgi:hypothetical protein